MGTDIQYREAIVTFIDILGFKDMLSIFNASEIYDVFQLFHSQYGQNSLSNHEFHGKTYETEVYFFSDSVVRVKYTDYEDMWQNTASDEIISLAIMQHELLKRNILVRGGCTKGLIYSNSASNVLFGPALVEAYKMENELSVYPRIVINKMVWQNYMSDMTTTSHWIRSDSIANRGSDFMQVADVKYNTAGWSEDARLLNLKNDISFRGQWYVNYFWGPSSSEILSLLNTKTSNDQDAIPYLEDKLLNLVEAHLYLLSNYDRKLNISHTNERIKMKQLWCRFHLHETVKDMYEWINGFELTFLLSCDIINSLAKQADLFFERYGLIDDKKSKSPIIL